MASELDARYATAMLDWLACAARGAREPAARAATALGSGLLDRVAAAGTAGHVLDYDDTYLPGVAHLSAATAPAALVLGAEQGASVAEALDAFAAGFEAMGALARASHPALYDGGWHPTAICGSLGAAVVSSRLLRLAPDRERSAMALALLRAAGPRSSFGSAGKSLGVGLAAAAGVAAARIAAAGASLELAPVVGGPAGFERAFGASFAEPGDGAAAVEQNWIKAYPCCLQTHGAIEAAAEARQAGVLPAGDPGAPPAIEVSVHPLSLQAAPIEQPGDGLQAKFSIPYLTGFALRHGPPGVDDFAALDPGAAHLAAGASVRAEPALGESEAVLTVAGGEVARVRAALGSPQRPMDEAALAAKRRALVGERLEGALEDPGRPVAELLEAAGL